MKNDQIDVMSKLLKMIHKQDRHDSRLAWVITTEYEVSLDEEILFDAVMKEKFQWLFFVWASQKNFLGSRHDVKSIFITFEQLFELIIRIFG
jgi:hypothetical protein